MLLIFLHAKIGQKFENAGQIWGKDRAKIELLYSANGKNGASGLGVYNTYNKPEMPIFALLRVRKPIFARIFARGQR